jgi:benzoyl-CoA reductase subunit C
MKRTLQFLTEITESPYSWLKQWKEETGRKVIGCFPMYVPEEIIHAAGLLPVVLLEQEQAITLADNYIQPYICSPVRSNLDLSLKGGMDCLDGIVFPDICEPAQMIAEVWNVHQPLPFFHNMMVPVNTSTNSGLDRLTREFFRMKGALEKFTGRPITQESLKNSIAIYNENRRLLHRLYQLRREHPERITGREMAAVVASSMLMLKEEHSHLLERLLEKLGAVKPTSTKRARLVISGSFCDIPEVDILDMIEDMGAIVVDDDLYVGRRYFQTLVNEQEEPIAALARRYIDDVPCPTKYNPNKDWSEYLLKLCRDAKADGVIIIIVKFCEPHDLDYPRLKLCLTQDNMPHLLIETDHSGATGQIRTRLQAFIEMLQG